MNLKKILILALFVAAGTMTMQAQKFGYLNSAQLLLEMPDIKTADSQLSDYQKQLVTKGEQMVKDFEVNYNAYLEEANQGILSKIQMQQRESALQKEQQSIQQYELQVQQQLAQRREELYQPILDKVKVALEKLGKEEGYTMIFDTSAGGLLHADNSEDIMPLIKARLGI